MIRKGMACNGRWAIDVAEPGTYTFELRRWPREEDRAITEGIPGKLTPYYGGNAIAVSTACIRVGGTEKTQSIGPNDKGIAFTYALDAGETSLETELTDGNGISLGAYYVYVEKE